MFSRLFNLFGTFLSIITKICCIYYLIHLSWCWCLFDILRYNQHWCCDDRDCGRDCDRDCDRDCPVYCIHQWLDELLWYFRLDTIILTIVTKRASSRSHLWFITYVTLYWLHVPGFLPRDRSQMTSAKRGRWDACDWVIRSFHRSRGILPCFAAPMESRDPCKLLEKPQKEKQAGWELSLGILGKSTL